MKDKELWQELITTKGWKVIEQPEPNYEVGWRKVMFAGTGWYLIFDRHLNLRFLETVKKTELVLSDVEKFGRFFKILGSTYESGENETHKLIRLPDVKFVIVLSKIDEYVRTEKYV